MYQLRNYSNIAKPLFFYYFLQPLFMQWAKIREKIIRFCFPSIIYFNDYLSVLKHFRKEQPALFRRKKILTNIDFILLGNFANYEQCIIFPFLVLDVMWNNDLFVKYRVPKNKLQVVKRVCTIEQKQYSNARYSWLPNIAISLPKVFTEVWNPEKSTIIIYDVSFRSIFLK